MFDGGASRACGGSVFAGLVDNADEGVFRGCDVLDEDDDDVFFGCECDDDDDLLWDFFF